MSNEGVCRTAPATPGLLIMSKGITALSHSTYCLGALPIQNVVLVLLSGGQRGKASRWRVFYQRGLPRLVL